MSTFHPFPRLPSEFRAYIWSLAAHPRLVHVRVVKDPYEVVHVVTPTPSPPVMQVCHESRRHGPYRWAFTIGSEPRYIWVNFEIDMICLRNLNALMAFEPHKLDIQRLMIFARYGCSRFDGYYDWEVDELRNFPALKEIHDAIDHGCLGWSALFAERYWGACPRGNIRFIDTISGIMLNGYQLSAAADWGIFHSWDGGGKIEDVNNLEEEIRIADHYTHMSLSDIRAVE
ncbi:hypothetical protein TrVFT333_011140 [Trichoderma virens FT-333]|nr:hypothetical protein TrVFT333_011140 [Trichoderma virens FT-333]